MLDRILPPEIIGFPIPQHNGIILSSGISRNCKIAEIKDLLLQAKDQEFEKLSNGILIRLLTEEKDDSIWCIRWEKGNQMYIGIILGSEF